MRHLILASLVVVLGLADPAIAQRSQAQVFGLPTSEALFDDTAVHDIHLRMSARDWDTLKAHYLENTYYPADFYWRDQVIRNVGIRSRGTGSRNPVKPHLRIAFGRYVSGQTFLGLSDVVLRNNTQDPSNMRERLSMALFQRLGVPASRESYTRLYVNDEYMGLYTIVEMIDDRYIARRFPAADGYLFSYDYPATAAPYYFEDRGDDPNTYVPLPFKPENHDTDPQPEVIAQMVLAVNRSSDAVFTQAASEYINLPMLIRQVAIETYLGDDDGFLGGWGMNNLYLYRLSTSHAFTFLPWDKSNAFLGGVRGSIWHGILDVPPAMQNVLIRRALARPEFLAIYLDTLLDCARTTEDTGGSVTGWLAGEIERQYHDIHDFVWLDTKKPFTNAEFEQAVDDLRAFARERGTFVRDSVAAARQGR